VYFLAAFALTATFVATHAKHGFLHLFGSVFPPFSLLCQLFGLWLIFRPG
jgi:hypothetical protein